MLGLFSHGKNNENTNTTTIDDNTRLSIKIAEPPYYSRLYFYRNDECISDVTIDFDDVQEVLQDLNRFTNGELTKSNLLNILSDYGLKLEQANDELAAGPGS